jgi:glycosyltransferase involved in cell wall biosynthesis/predicted metal-dependent phosphoesterase TrpH
MSDPSDAPARKFDLPNPRRVDLHCHSLASTKTTEKTLDFIRCPESYSPPEDVYRQARQRGMDFVTITDHDAIDGVLTIAHRPDVLVGEELTCWFPEDDCKLHLLVFGIDQAQHDHLQSIARNIYEVAEFIESRNIAHSVAHPIYRQNDKLERWHLERLLLLFKGFECLNGAHMQHHREAFEPVLDRLNRAEIARLSDVHNLKPRWPEPWHKARTAGTDDHGLLNVGRTWTEFPPQVDSVDDILTCLREGSCRPGGEAGSTLKLAHTFYSVALRYNAGQLERNGRTPGTASILMQSLVGARKTPTRFELARAVVRGKLRKTGNRLRQLIGFKSEASSGLIRDVFLDAVKKQIRENPGLFDMLKGELPPLSRHEEMFDLFQKINRDVTLSILEAGYGSTRRGNLVGMTDAVSAFMAQQFVLTPYYFALFHQNKERHLLPRITRMESRPRADTIRVGLFTDTFDDINGVGRFIRDMGEQALSANGRLTIHTSVKSPRFELANRKNFEPILSRPLPYYETLSVSIPPVLEMLVWADQQQFDVIHVSTPGPVGLVGALAAKMLRVPMLATYHTDFPAYIHELTHDARMTRGCEKYMRWFYRRCKTVFSRSDAYHFNLRQLGMPQDNLRTIRAGINTTKFNPRHRDPTLWVKYGIREKFKVLYVGRVSVEKNVPLLVEAFRQLCERRRDVALVVAGEGPFFDQAKQKLSGLPAYLLGPRNDAELGAMYATADLFAFPSRTDTLGQVVMEAQSSGLPTLVAPEGGPREIIEPDASGLVLNGEDAGLWAQTISELVDDEPRRESMRAAAVRRADRYDLKHTFEGFWNEHVEAVRPEPHDEIAPMPTGR